MVRLYLSTNPLALGLAVLITLWSIPRPYKYLSKLPKNSLPLSVLTTKGTPYLVVMLAWKWERMVVLFKSIAGQASTHLLLTQTQVTKYF
jgi:hypothetical protein